MRINRRDVLLVAVVIVGAATVMGSVLAPLRPAPVRERRVVGAVEDLGPVVERVDAAVSSVWERHGYQPAARAADLAILRRMHLSLQGSIPSLEEIRRFEADRAPGRISRAAVMLLEDRRSADYLAERFARAYVGVEDGPFIVFRRRRFVAWLGDAIHENRPYDALVRSMICDEGIWTDDPPTNFITVTRDEKTERPSPERLGARVARAFLGVRLDCAQCHDHPFQPWKQEDFRGLASFFGALHATLGGVKDRENDYRPLDRTTHQPEAVPLRVPFQAELLPLQGKPRERLAAWLTNPANRGFSRALVNRAWAIVFGKPLVAPIDDLGSVDEPHPALDVLADDFRSHGFDLRRLFRVILATRAFALESEGNDTSAEGREECWAVFPMTRLRPEQVAGSLFQQASTIALDAQSHWLVRLVRYAGVNDFVRRYGDLGEDEFTVQSGTIPQRLLLMNGKLAGEQIEAGFFSASARLATLAPDDAAAVELAYLTVLTRRPTAEESAYFAAKFKGLRGKTRREQMTDLFWTLINATEFSWNH